MHTAIKNFFIALIILITSYTTIVNAFPIKTQLAAGSFYQNKKYLPFILKSIDNGQSWSYINIKNIVGLPDNLSWLYFPSIRCLENLCTVVGAANDARPMLLKSYDSGDSWSLDKIFGDGDGWLKDLKCTNKICVAVGGTASKSLLILNSFDNGQTWMKISSFVDLPNASVDAKRVSCTQDTCVTVGHRMAVIKNNLTNLLAIVISENNFQTWRYIKTIANFPNTSNSHLVDVNCLNDVCIAVGDYSTSSQNLPVLIRSEDKGKTWHFINEINGFSPQGRGFANPKVVQCFANSCLAVGSIGFGDDSLQPFILQSQNKGQSWSMVKEIEGMPSKPGTLFFGAFYGSKTTSIVGCENSKLIDNDYVYSPVLIVSHDSGRTWKVTKNISGLPTKLSGLSITNISCTSDTCFVSGNYEDDKHSQRPLLLLSKDQGNSWAFVEAQNLPAEGYGYQLDTTT